MTSIQGTPISPGIAIGKVLIKNTVKHDILFIQGKDKEQEKDRFHTARTKAIEEVTKIYNEMIQTKGENEAQIFDAHITMLEDIELIEGVEVAIDEQSCNAEWALDCVANQFIAIFEAMEDAYMKERAMDIKDITSRIQRLLAGTEAFNILDLSEPSIIIADDLTPSDTAQMNPELVIGIINEIGGPTSHAAIIARMLGIPLVVAPHMTELTSNGQMMVFDGETGAIYTDPTEECIKTYKEKQIKLVNKRAALEQLKGTKSITSDGIKVELAGNIGVPKDVKMVLENDGEGIGLFRTEFLYMSRSDFPDEEEQFLAYKEVLEKMDGRPVVIRTLDIGGDKELDYLEIPKEMNPFLGCRAIRLCLKNPLLWKVQVRALLRASAYGELRIMIPMIADMEELIEAKSVIEETKEELRQQRIPFNEHVEVGMMMETPAAAIMADLFAEEVDFFSIGTNDLIQYTIAVDRMNTDVAHLYSSYQPAVIRLIKKIVDSAHAAGIWAGMCGEAAADKKLIPLWIGMGIDELSMSPRSILETREQVQNLSQKQCAQVVDEVVLLKTKKMVEERLNKELTEVL
ncbi:phosphoenolpyruvate--protein phosphotransferase [Cellulosilyticum sp. I15G10I2]|uniref:phosphoenolpyruvate--protein phosphotransferase n=1 Tax=Cellulosilyticum sp. I15G10I2 TaxID=1892843 RepID=UPI00085BBBF4|nr:phosphoenolpyruvate--protein phosphotransferase [Cellulosilyticum sp. I15G10I2]